MYMGVRCVCVSPDVGREREGGRNEFLKKWPVQQEMVTSRKGTLQC